MEISGLIAPTVLEKPQPPQRDPSGAPSGTKTAAPTAPAVPAAAVTELSRHARALSTLQSLSATDPAKFKQAALSYADALKAQAAQVGDVRGEHLSRLAHRFDEAAQTGSLTALHLPAPPPGSVQAAYARSGAQSLRPPQAHYRGLARGAHAQSIADTSAPLSNALRAVPPQA